MIEELENQLFDFSKALKLLKEGKSVSRVGWNGKGLFISLQTPTETSKMTRPYLFLTSPIGSTNQFNGENKEHLVPWLASQTDLLAEDWCIIN